MQFQIRDLFVEILTPKFDFFFGQFIKQRINDVSKEIKRVRAQMEEDEQLSVLMRGLRGQNLKDSTFADDSIQLRLVEVRI